jgi:hypothetical protein
MRLCQLGVYWRACKLSYQIVVPRLEDNGGKGTHPSGKPCILHSRKEKLWKDAGAPFHHAIRRLAWTSSCSAWMSADPLFLLGLASLVR